MKTLKQTLVFGFTLIALCIQAQTGKIITKIVEVPNFTKLEVISIFEVELKKSETNKVTFMVDEFFADRVNANVKNGILSISLSKGKTKTKSKNKKVEAKAIVEYQSLESLETSDASNVWSATVINVDNFLLDCSGTSEIDLGIKAINLIADFSGATDIDLTLNVQNLKTNISGATDVSIIGSVNEHISDVSGAANLKAAKLITQKTIIDLSGASNADVYAKKMLKATESGASSLKHNSDVEEINIENEQLLKKKLNSKNQIYNYNINDTTRVRIGDFKIEVFENDDSIRVKVGGIEVIVNNDGNVALCKDEVARKKRKSRFNGHWAGFELGINGYLNNENNTELPLEYDFLDLRYEKSIAVNFNILEQNFGLIKEKFGMLTGLGIQYNNYRFDNDVNLIKGENELEGEYLEFENKYYIKSKLTASYMIIPLLFEYQTNSYSKKNSFHAGVGGQFGLRIGSHTKKVYSNDKRNRNKEKERDDFYLNPFKLDAMARIGWGKVNLFGTYSFNTLFKKNKGPELYPFTLGITLASW